MKPFPALLAAWSAAASVLGAEASRVEVIHDLVERFDGAVLHDAAAASAGRREVSGGVALPGIFLHPGPRGAATARMDGLAVPAAAEGLAFLVFRIGLRDGIPWDPTGSGANGVRFAVRIDGEEVFAEETRGDGWRPRAVELSRWAGRDVSLVLETGAIDGNTAYDWSVWGDPIVVCITGTEVASVPREGRALGLAEVECAVPSRVVFAQGRSRSEASVPAGVHWLPLELDGTTSPSVEVVSGDAIVRSVVLAPFAPRCEVRELSVSSPLILAGEPFDALLRVENSGRGTLLPENAGARRRVRVRLEDALGGAAREAERIVEVGRLEAGKERTLRVPSLLAERAGRIVLSEEERELAARVFGVRPPADTRRPAAGSTASYRRELTGGGACAAVSNHWSRVRVIAEASGHAYGVLEHHDGNGWIRSGSIYPLGRLVLARGPAGREELEWTARELAVSGENALEVRMVAADSLGTGWELALAIEALAESPRLRLRHEVAAPRSAALRAFAGPAVLAGDRAWGERKDFAIFPGVEYLEGDEPSSSARDLAPPLHDRHVPAPHKVTAPLMAVAAEGALTALLWPPRARWSAVGEEPFAARFLAPAAGEGLRCIQMGLSVPPVGTHVPENRTEATAPFAVEARERLEIRSVLVLDHAARFAAMEERPACGPHRGGLVLEAFAHWFEEFGLPEPSPPPRDWEAEKALSRRAYFEVLWQEEPAGWSHCAGWSKGVFAGHTVPLILDRRDGAPPPLREEIERRVSKVIGRAVRERGAQSLWSGAGCHIVLGELPFFRGYLAENLEDLRRHGRARLQGREDGLWVWRPASRRHESLGRSGDHTLGQAALASFEALRAARISGDPELAAEALEAMRQMDRYEVPRGAQTWECPLYQPDILAAAYAVRAYCEAYRLTGDAAHLEHARYWAWTGLPFIYMWELEDRPAMRYNAIAVIGSTFHTHSWIGLPVVWCGLVYAYALQDLALFDDSFPWRRVAEGITRSAEWQQYTAGTSAGCYPDSWDLVRNEPRPADINPENILLNEFRLRGRSPEIHHARIPAGRGFAHLNSAGEVLESEGSIEGGALRFRIRAGAGFPVYSSLSPAGPPQSVWSSRAGGEIERVETSDTLDARAEAWMYSAALRAVIVRTVSGEEPVEYRLAW